MTETDFQFEPGLPPETCAPPLAPPRTPNIGHAIFFIVFTLGTLLLIQLASIAIAHRLPSLRSLSLQQLAQLPRLMVLTNFIAYTLILLLAVLVFPAIWHRSFAAGISWNLDAARRYWRRLIVIGVAVAFIGAEVESFLSIPKDLPIDKMFDSRTDLWLITILGTLLAPMFEEICFRGFLLPALAIAWDWLSLPRTPQARLRWQSTTSLSPTSLVVAAILTSVGFAWMHGKQLNFTFGPLVVLFCVSLALSAVRIRLRSVAASSLVHASYNGLIFVITFISTGGYQHLDKLPH